MKKILTASLLLAALTMRAWGQGGSISGRVTDAASGQPVAGAMALLEGTLWGAVADAQGNFTISKLPTGAYTLRIGTTGYHNFVSEPITLGNGESRQIDVPLHEQINVVEQVVATARRTTESDVAVTSEIRQSKTVLSGISSAQIGRSQDKDAGEAVRRISGISVVDDKFIVVRGLSQRYNNTWINGAAQPSSEADSRAFSLDVIPSSQIESIMIAKSPAAEYPADFSGGFVMIRTRMTERNFLTLSLGTGINSQTHFKDFDQAKGSPTDWLGFDSGMRSLAGFVPAKVDIGNTAMVDRTTREGFGNEDWGIRTRRPMWDRKLNFSMGRSRTLRSGDKVALSAAANYSLASRTIPDMVNRQFGVYNTEGDTPVTIFNYRDDLYTTDAKLGAMLNLSYAPQSKGSRTNRYELHNVFNQLGRNRITFREGWRDKSGFYEQQQTEYLYQSRTTYSGQFSGKHHLSDRRDNRVEWNAGYSYSNRYQPDRRIVERQTDPTNGIPSYDIFQSSIQRFYTALDEHMATGGVNYSLKLNPGTKAAKAIELRTGLLGEWKTRNYRTREFAYKWDMVNTLPADLTSLSTVQIMQPGNLGAPDRLHIQDETSKTNDYTAGSSTLAAFVAVDIPVGRLDIYAGLRMESYRAAITSYINASSNRTRSSDYNYNNLFPSVNASLEIDHRSLLRLAYGMSVNRQEFRELSPSSYYDFDIFSRITGNPDLRQATIHNLEMRYELYPSAGETVTLALFYKRFKDPIEWVYIDAGGTIQYTFMNADWADSYGIELDVRKKLNVIGLPNFTATLNASLIRSVVHITRAGVSYDRPMQGQSPYLVNVGVFYQPRKAPVTLGALYNRIGERIIGIGRVQGSDGSSFNNNLPDMYETPRNMIDLTFSWKIGKIFELGGAARDILSEKCSYVQHPKFIDATGVIQTRTQTPREFRSGRNFQLTLSATF
ncbi:hypothetical protein FACS1894159_04960 [Bacteroidia bacterium]|nr:hypothetical protein FACS1894159_04960 [Bacteroidia bacterium]